MMHVISRNVGFQGHAQKVGKINGGERFQNINDPVIILTALSSNPHVKIHIWTFISVNTLFLSFTFVL